MELNVTRKQGPVGRNDGHGRHAKRDNDCREVGQFHGTAVKETTAKIGNIYLCIVACRPSPSDS
eukprot:21301-Eustigmatos_ZCMA.PRE.1